MISFIVDFEPAGRRGNCRSDETILDCARRLGVGINNICGGIGTCQACKVKLMRGSVSEASSAELDAFSLEELEEGWRLACQVHPQSDCKIHIPPDSMTTPQRTQVEGLETAFKLEPSVRTYPIELTSPSLHDLQADSERLLEVLNRRHNLQCSRVDLHVLQTLSDRLRAMKWHCQVSVHDNQVIAVHPPGAAPLGLAVDLGTTKIAGYMVNLETGKTLATRGLMNPQISYGEDVISRINIAMGSPESAGTLQHVVVSALNDMTTEMCAEVNASTERVVEVVIAGNTAMHHLLLALPVKQLALSPYVPSVSHAVDIKARDIGLTIAAGAYLHLLPNIAGFVGGDHVAMLLATEAYKAGKPVVAIDIGTNTEVSLIHNGKITSVSCASGPAFEGGHIKDGMRATDGAIEKVRILDGKVSYQTINDAPPVGLCGSGIVDTIAQLYSNGVIDESGRMVNNHPLVRREGTIREFVIAGSSGGDAHPEVVITQKDVRQLQMAKAAIRSGIQILLEDGECSEEQIEQVIIAGAFGSYIDITSAMIIGMLPSLPIERVKQVGNAAGFGAKLALVSRQQRLVAQEIASGVGYIELGNNPHFMDTFIEAGVLGRYRIINHKRVEIE
jgi:uncharacterized 2Fe-2S/4Fe-4S cluster protein (DUF4445 family)